MGRKGRLLFVYFGVLALALPYVYSAVSTEEIANHNNKTRSSVGGGSLSEFHGQGTQAMLTITKPTSQDPPDNLKPPEIQADQDIYFYITEFNSRVCGLSVCNDSLTREPCGSRYCDMCYCDEECGRYGDCCPDYYLASPHQPPQADISCISQAFIASDLIQSNSYKMVSSCPDLEFPTDDQIATKDKCLNPNQARIQENIPVYSEHTELHYRNFACAECNGIVNATEWSVMPICNYLVNVSSVSSHDDLFRLMAESCAVHFEPPPNKNIRECMFTVHSIKTCNVTGNWTNYDPNIARACSLYSQPFVHLDDVYENIFCASCNGIELKRDFYCTIVEWSAFEGLTGAMSAIMNIPQEKTALRDFTNEDEHRNCTGREVYDTVNGMCRPLVCPEGRHPEDSECVSDLPDSQDRGYILHFLLTPRQQPFFSVIDLFQLAYVLSKQINCKVTWIQPKRTLSSVNVTFTTLLTSTEKRVQEIDVQYSLVVSPIIPINEMESQLVGMARSKFWWQEHGSKSPVYFDFKWQTGVSSARLDNLKFVYTNGTLESRVFTIAENPEAVADDFKINASSYILVNDLLMCNMIELNMSEYTLVNSSHIFINSTGEILDEERYVWNGDSVRVCTNFIGDIPQSQTKANTTLPDQTEVTLTFVCTCLSLCGLAVTIVIYLAVPSVRQQLPGKNNLCLFVNLFLAQLLFLTGSTAKVSRAGCQALGIIIHYFWLATFCWKVVCAYHMYRLFTSPLKVLDQTKSLYRYLLFSHLFPTLWIIGLVSINLGLSDLVRIGYADRQNLCFLSSTLDVVLGSVVPVGLVIMFNTFFFSRTIYALRHRPKVQRQAAKSDVRESVVYFKMSLLFGFTWITGFVAMLVNERGMWYVFTVVNASIGVFIFVSFGLKNLSPSVLMHGRHMLDHDTASSLRTFDTSADVREKVAVTSVSSQSMSANLNKTGLDDANWMDDESAFPSA